MKGNNKGNLLYRLVTTHTGFKPIFEVQEGEEVYCKGEWKKAPKPEIGPCYKCSFVYYPTTIFEKKLITSNRVSVWHNFKLPGTKNPKPELAIRGAYKDSGRGQIIFYHIDDLKYWLPKYIKYYDYPILPQITNVGVYYVFFPDDIPYKELHGDELTERNIEYVLEGMLRRGLSTFCSRGFLSDRYTITMHVVIGNCNNWDETSSLAIRLLDIECYVDKKSSRTRVANPIQLLRHIKDDYNKKKLSDDKIVNILKQNNFRRPDYFTDDFIQEMIEVDDWILPGINPDINTINPL